MADRDTGHGHPTERLIEALGLIRDGRCQCGGRFKWKGSQLRCEQCDRHEGPRHAREIARAALESVDAS